MDTAPPSAYSPWSMKSAIRLVRLGFLLICLLGAAIAGNAAGAQAATVVVGSPLVGSFNSGVTFKEQTTVANTSLADPSANLTSPVSGMVVRWRMTGFYLGGPFKLRILRPVGGGKYLGAGTSAPQARSGSGIQVVPTQMPIQAGDLIGLEGSNASDGFSVANTGSSFSIWQPPLEDGLTAAPAPGSASELGFDAVVQPQPQVVLISPTSGPLAGGTSVKISGHEFTSVSAVKFGSTPAASFTVESEDLITAVSPPSATPGTVDITVTAAGGTNPTTAADQFTYLTPPSTAASCKVPKLKGATLKQARKRLRRAHCKLGKVSGKKGRSARVVKQRPKPGKQLPAGGKVNLKLG
jgi:IPT/TIG domain-containing protein/PASTA domain-containing protein